MGRIGTPIRRLATRAGSVTKLAAVLSLSWPCLDLIRQHPLPEPRSPNTPSSPMETAALHPEAPIRLPSSHSVWKDVGVSRLGLVRLLVVVLLVQCTRAEPGDPFDPPANAATVRTLAYRVGCPEGFGYFKTALSVVLSDTPDLGPRSTIHAVYGPEVVAILGMLSRPKVDQLGPPETPDLDQVGDDAHQVLDIARGFFRSEDDRQVGVWQRKAAGWIEGTDNDGGHLWLGTLRFGNDWLFYVVTGYEDSSQFQVVVDGFSPIAPSMLPGPPIDETDVSEWTACPAGASP